MVWSDEIEAFVRAHIGDDVRLLALRKQQIQGEELRTALMQIELRQRVIEKLPSFASTPGIRFPSRLATEQCSSERAALFKRKIVGGHYKKGVDLTGGMGIDTVALSFLCDEMTYVEQNPELCEAARHNFPLIANNVTVCETTAEKWLDENRDSGRVGLLFVDPARRDYNGGKVFRIEECTPDIKSLLPRMMAAAEKVVVKLSPMLDVKECIEALHPDTITIVSVNNECKELVAVITGSNRETEIEAVELRKDDCLSMRFTLSEEAAATGIQVSSIEKGMVIAEPYAAFMKSGAWKTLCHRYNAQMLAPSSHLYIAGGDFPGRRFLITQVCDFNKRNAAMILKGQANLTVRNFPMSVAEVRKRFKTQDGGERYIFLTTTNDNRKLIIEGTKI